MNDPIALLLGSWASGINVWSVLLRIALSVAVSSVVGCERSSKRHSAGLRTFILVSLSATLAAVTDACIMAASDMPFPLLSAAVVIASALISGNSILFSSKNQIKGLTTSAGLWTCSIIGLAAGSGLYTLTLIGSFTLVLVLVAFPDIERVLKDRSNHFEVHLEMNAKNNLNDFTMTVRELGLRIDDIESNPAYIGTGIYVYSVSLTIISPELKKYKSHSEIIKALSTIEYVSHIEEMN